MMAPLSPPPPRRTVEETLWDIRMMHREMAQMRVMTAAMWCAALCGTVVLFRIA